MKSFIVKTLLLWVCGLVPVFAMVAGKVFLLQSVSRVDVFQTLPASNSNDQLLITVPHQCVDCLDRALRSADYFAGLSENPIRVHVVILTNWEKAQGLFKNKISLSPEQRDLLWVDPGGRILKNYELQKSSFILFSASGRLLVKGELPKGISDQELSRRFKAAKEKE